MIKKRILALLLAVITITQICITALPVIAEDTEGSSMIGAVVRFNTESQVYLYPLVTENSIPYAGERFYPNDLPETFRVLDAVLRVTGRDGSGTLYYKLGTVDGSANAILDKYCWVNALLVEIVSKPEPDTDELVTGEIELSVDGEKTNTLTIARDEKTYVYTELSQLFTGTPTYRWELLIDRDKNRWGTVQDYVYPYAAVSRALIANAGIEGTTAVLRCVVFYNGTSYVSNELTIVMEETAEGEQLANFGASNTANSVTPRDAEAFQVVIQYVYWNNSSLPEAGHGETAMPTYTATVSENYPLTATVPALTIAGYKPYIRDDSKPAGARPYTARENPDDPESAVETHYYVESTSIIFTDQVMGYEVTVYYLPELVPFTINHHIQNLDDDEYTLYHTDDLTGYSLSPVGENLQMADLYGFSNLFYDPNTPISPNGNTAVDIYYDREYYLIDFNLGDGYGVMPLYVRYGTTVQVGTPQNPGYTFEGWTLNRVYNKTETTVDGKVEVTETEVTDQDTKNQYNNPANAFTVAHNLEYTARWTVANTNYTLIYWLENTDSTDSTNKNNYSIWHTKSYSAKTGDKTIAGSDNIKSNVTGNDLTEVNTDYPFLTYNKDLTDTVAKTVAADGTTTINVYYQRKEYTLRFYYARKSDNTWYVAGMTDTFAREANTRIDRNDERELLNDLGQWNEVTSEPKLKDGVATSKKYSESSITYKNNTYKYFEFKAKYGADIGSKWPVDTMGTVDRTSGTGSNGWSKTTVIMSAWTGEYNVRHQHDNPNGSTNQTIKGKYEVLDEYLMWDPTYDGWNTAYNDGTISFLCFWENASKTHDWNIPELYRYKIWLPTIAGETYPDNTTFVTRDGVEYYLFDTYDTCDNSTINEQTHPALTGFKKKDRLSVPNNASDDANIFNANRDFNRLTNRQYTTQEEFNELRTNTYTSTYARAYIVNYFYTRNEHQLIKNDNAGSSISTKLSYGVKLNAYNVAPNYPIVYEAGNYTFGGWYQDQACTIPFNFNITMPDKNVQMYASWIPTTFSFTVYQEKPTDNNPNPTVLFSQTGVEFGTLPNTLGEEPTRESPIKDYIFAGWYYEDENGHEQRFDFNTMPIKHDYVIYAKWTSEVPVRYIVYYKTLKDGVWVDIAAPTEGKALAGITKSFMAKVGLELYDGYRSGYYPTEREHTHKMEHVQEEDGVNEIIFEYVTSQNFQYQVRHVFVSESFVNVIGTNTLEMVWAVKVTSATSAKLEENFQDEIKKDNVKKKLKSNEHNYSEQQAEQLWGIIVNLSPDAFNKSLILVPSENPADNEILFNWSGLYEMTIYEVHHMCEVSPGEYTLRGEPRVYNARYTANAKVGLPDPLTFTGYKYANRYTTNNANNQSLQLQQATAEKKGLIIYLYYDREEYSYTVRYREENGALISHSPVVTGKADYQTALRVGDLVQGINIPGYALINGDDVVTLEYNNQVIDCIYRRQTASYVYRPLSGSGRCDPLQNIDVLFGNQPTGSLATPDEGWILEGWYVGDVSGGNLQDISTVGATVDDEGRLIPRAPTAEDVGKTYYFWAKFVPTTLTIESYINAATVSLPNWLIPGQGFIYHVQGKADTPTANYSVTVAVPVNESVTILGLPVGEYTISVEADWSWRYANFAGEQEVELTLENPSVTAYFNYNPPNPDTNNGYFYVTGNTYNNTNKDSD